MLHQLILKNRSYRRFNTKRKIEKAELEALIELARLTPSAKNNQPLKYMLLNDEADLQKVFPCLAWAGYLKNWPGPDKTEQPTAYIIVLRDNEISTNHFCDDGIAIQTILLGAVEKGLGGCIIGAFDKQKLVENLKIRNQYQPLYVIALGEPVEQVEIEELEDNVKYWRDDKQVHHVPKRSLNEIIIT